MKGTNTWLSVSAKTAAMCLVCWQMLKEVLLTHPSLDLFAHTTAHGTAHSLNDISLSLLSDTSGYDTFD